MINVLFIDSAEAMGGAEHSLLLLLQHLDRMRFRPVLACNVGTLGRLASENGVQVEWVVMRRLRRSLLAPWRLLTGVRGLVRLIRREGIDVLQCNNMRASFYAAVASRLTRRPLLWHVRDIHSSERYIRWMARHATRIVAVSEAAATPIRSSAAVAVLPNGVDLSAFRPSESARSEARRALNYGVGTPIVGMVGRLERWKGQDDFVRAMALVRDGCSEARYLVVGGAIFGGDAYESELRRLVGELGLEDVLVLAGHRSDVSDVLSAMDVLVHCSMQPEPFGRVLIEGMAAGLPIVAYAAGGVSEIVLDGRTGLLCLPGDVYALAEAVLALLRDPARAHTLGEAGRRRAEQNYGAQQHARRLEQMIAATEEARGGSCDAHRH